MSYSKGVTIDIWAILVYIVASSLTISMPNRPERSAMHYPYGMLVREDSLYVRLLKMRLVAIMTIALCLGLLVGNLFWAAEVRSIFLLMGAIIVIEVIDFVGFRRKIRYHVTTPKQMWKVLLCRIVLFTRALICGIFITSFEWWWQIITMVIFLGYHFFQWLRNAEQ